MDHPNSIVPIIGMLTPLVWGVMWFVFWAFVVFLVRRERMRVYDLIAEGKPVPPAMIEGLRRYGGPSTDLRAGLILLAVSAGMALCGIINFLQYHGPTPHLFHGVWSVFPIPGLVGVAFLIMAWVRRDETRGV